MGFSYSDLSVVMMQTKCFNNAELIPKLTISILQSKDTENKKYYEETRALEKWQSENSAEYLTFERRRKNHRCMKPTEF